MADNKISQLSSATLPLAGTESVPIVQSGATVKTPVTSFVNGRAITPTQVTVDGNVILNGGLGSDVGLLKNTGRGYGVASDRWIGSDGTFTNWFYNVPTGGKHYFAVNQSNKLGVDGDNVHIYLGNLIQGTAAKGINFTANTPKAGMTSQLLNWYEEGTCTVTLTPGSGSITLNANTLTYTRIGRQVTVTGRINVSAISSPSGTLTLAGLPFNVRNSADAIAAVSIYATGMASAPDGNIMADSWLGTNTVINFSVNANQITTSTFMRFAFTYFV